MSAELIGILGVGAALLVGLGGLILTIGGWLRGDIRALRSELQALGKRVARLEDLIEGSGLFRPAGPSEALVTSRGRYSQKCSHAAAQEAINTETTASASRIALAEWELLRDSGRADGVDGRPPPKATWRISGERSPSSLECISEAPRDGAAIRCGRAPENGSCGDWPDLYSA